MTPKNLAEHYFAQGRVMQIATLHSGSPRVNSVYYVVADDMSAVYWMSEPQRRHSEDLRHDARMAGAIAIKTDPPVAGVQFTGRGSVVQEHAKQRTIIAAYNQKYDNVAKGLAERIEQGTNKHQIYELTFESVEVFDELNLPGGGPLPVSRD